MGKCFGAGALGPKQVCKFDTSHQIPHLFSHSHLHAPTTTTNASAHSNVHSSSSPNFGTQFYHAHTTGNIESVPGHNATSIESALPDERYGTTQNGDPSTSSITMPSSPLHDPGAASPLDDGGIQRSQFTYRQLAQLASYSTSNPLRVVAHIDLDAFYAQCEIVRLGLPEDKPLAVQQW